MTSLDIAPIQLDSKIAVAACYRTFPPMLLSQVYDRLRNQAYEIHRRDRE